MATYIYDKVKKKVVLERERTDLPKQKSAYITKQFTGNGIKSKQLAPSLMAWKRDDPACYYKSYSDLERKAKSAGMVVNNHAADRASMEATGDE